MEIRCNVDRIGTGFVVGGESDKAKADASSVVRDLPASAIPLAWRSAGNRTENLRQSAGEGFGAHFTFRTARQFAEVGKHRRARLAYSAVGHRGPEAMLQTYFPSEIFRACRDRRLARRKNLLIGIAALF